MFCNCILARAFANTQVPDELAPELVLTAPQPEDKGLKGDGRPKVRRFRSRRLDLGPRLREFRREYGLTQAKFSQVVGAGSEVTVCQWETGVNVPDGHRRERLVDLLEGRLWRALRELVIEGDGTPRRWHEAARWYRRASRERPPRQTVGAVIAVALRDLRGVERVERLCRRYCEDDSSWIRGLAAKVLAGLGRQVNLRRVEDAAYGLRWLELAHGLRFDLGHSLVRQLPLALLGDGQSGVFEEPIRPVSS